MGQMPKKKKSKKSKGKTIKKLSTEKEIVQIQQILNGGSSNLSQLSNVLKDNLKGGSWNSKQYKGKFGTITKFLKKHNDAFIVQNTNGEINVKNRPPPPPKPKRAKQTKKAKKEVVKDEGGLLITIFFILLLLGGTALSYFCFFNENTSMECRRTVN